MSNSFYEFFCPVKIIVSLAALEHAPYELATRGAARALLVTDEGIRKAGLLKQVETVFEESQVEIAAVFDQVPPDSSFEVFR
jgi:alcohol dehydrogenase